MANGTVTILADPVPYEDTGQKQPGQWRRKGDNGPPIVTDPDGVTTQAGRVALRTYSRPSNFGKQVENTYNLEKWNERMVALGLSHSMMLAADLDQIVVELDHDSPEFKSAVDGIVVEAKRRAGAMVKAEQGTVGHLITEDSDLGRSIITRIEQGEDVGLPAHIQLAVREAWQQLIDEHFEILAVEFPCIYDRWRVAGTGDRIVRVKKPLTFNTPSGWEIIPAGAVLVLDIKTGGLKTDRNGLPLYWLSYAVQIAAYALSQPYDIDTETRGEWPWEINSWRALIAHLDIGRALETGEMVAQLVYVDLQAGWEAGELVCRAKEWQRRKDVFSIVGQHVVTIAAPASAEAVEPDTTGSDPPTTDPVVDRTPPQEEESSGTNSTQTARFASGTDCLTKTPSTEKPDETPLPDWSTPSTLKTPNSSTRDCTKPDRSMVVARAKTLIDAGHGPRLAYTWPTYPDGKPIPGFKADDKGNVHDHTPAELAAILAAIRQVEDEQSMPFHEADAPAPDLRKWESHVVDTSNTTSSGASETRMRIVASFPVPIDEGDLINDDDYQTLVTHYEALSDNDRDRLAIITGEAKAAALPISLTERRSVRRWEIARALILWHQVGWDSDVVRDLLAAIVDNELVRHYATPLGAVVGTLTIDEAKAFAETAQMVLDGAALSHTNGRWTISA